MFSLFMFCFVSLRQEHWLLFATKMVTFLDQKLLKLLLLSATVWPILSFSSFAWIFKLNLKTFLHCNFSSINVKNFKSYIVQKWDWIIAWIFIFNIKWFNNIISTTYTSESDLVCIIISNFYFIIGSTQLLSGLKSNLKLLPC